MNTVENRTIELLEEINAEIVKQNEILAEYLEEVRLDRENQED